MVTSIVDELPDPYPMVLGLVDVEGEAVDDAAEIMGLSPATVALLCAEGRRRYRALLARVGARHGQTMAMARYSPKTSRMTPHISPSVA